MNIETKPNAVLWDFDGTLLDTEPLWMASEKRVMASYGADWTTEQALQLVGMPQDHNTKIMLDHIAAQVGSRPDVDPAEFWRQVSGGVGETLATGELPWRPGALELLAELHELGTPMALVSASPRELLAAGVAGMIPGVFSTIVSGDELANGKPAPDGYLRAADQLNVDSYDCVVIEDSLPGVQAGRASGAVVVAVPCAKPLPLWDGQINLDSLAGITVDDLNSFWYEVRRAQLPRAANA